jgi:sulfur transfer protein SufE
MQTRIAAAEQALTDELMVFPDAFERLAYLVDLFQTRPVPETNRKQHHLVHGCMAELYISPSQNGDCWTFTPLSEAPMVMALAGLYCRIFSGQSDADILGHQPRILDSTDLRRQLSPNRQAGAANIVAKIKAYVEGPSLPPHS